MFSIYQIYFNLSNYLGEELWLKERPQWVRDKNVHI